ncbi:MAG: hypothetical protein AABW72_04590 [archaeon]
MAVLPIPHHLFFFFLRKRKSSCTKRKRTFAALKRKRKNELKPFVLFKRKKNTLVPKRFGHLLIGSDFYG